MAGNLTRRIAVSVLIGISSALLCWKLTSALGIGAADFTWSIRAAHDIVSHHDPYRYAYSDSQIPYPLTAAIFGMPFLRFSSHSAGVLFFGLSSAVLAFALSRDGLWRLLIFLAWPYWSSMLTVQYAPLVMAGALIPWLLPASLAKPQIGLPIVLTHFSWRGVVACFSLFVISLLLMPSWPLRWLSQIRGFQHFVPIFVLPMGPALLLAIWRRKDEDSHLLLLTATVPQRWFYESFVLWLIPKNRQEILVTVFLSWGAGITRWYFMPRSWSEVGTWAVLWIYLPMLFVILLRGTYENAIRPRSDLPA